MAISLTNQGIDTYVDWRFRLNRLLREFLVVFVLTAIICAGTYAWLIQASPQYRGQAMIVIDPGESVAAGSDARVLDREIVASQAQLLRSHDLARTVAERFDLAHRAEFDPTLRAASPISDFLIAAGLRRDPRQLSPDERVLEQFSRNLSVSTDRSAVVTIAFSSGDPRLAAAVPNALAEEYVALQEAARRATTIDGADWLASEIDGLRQRVAQIESDVDAYRSRVDRLTGGLASRTLTDSQGESVLTPITRAEVEADLAELERDAIAQRELLDSYLRRYREALARRHSSGLPVSARIIARASVPNEPYYPRTGPLTAAIGLIAFTLMVAIVVIRELAKGRPANRDASVPLPEVANVQTDTERLRRGDDSGVRRIVPGTPSIAATAGSKPDGTVAVAAQTIAAEHFKRIMVVTIDGRVRDRPTPAGVALARAMAGGERRAVLIDLRDDAASSRSMGDGAALPGFSDLFAGKASFGQVIFRDRESRVHYIPTGLHPLARSGLAGERVRLLVSALDHTYDYVILDVGDDLIAAIGPVCDVVVVVTGPGDSDPRTADAVRRIRAVTNARIILLPTRGEEFAAADGEAA